MVKPHVLQLLSTVEALRRFRKSTISWWLVGFDLFMTRGSG